MVDRISDRQFSKQAIEQFTRTQREIADLQISISTGNRYQTAEDNPTVVAQLSELASEISKLKQFNKNGDNAERSLKNQESILSNVEELVSQLNQETLSAANLAFSTTEQRRIAATTLQKISDQLKGLANSIDPEGRYLFSGNVSQTPPLSETASGYEYNGDQGQRHVNIAFNRTIQLNHTVEELFFTASGNIFETIDQFTEALNNEDDLEVLARAAENTLRDIQNTHDTVLSIQVEVGISLQSTEDHRAQIESQLVLNKILQSELKDTNIFGVAPRLQETQTNLEIAFRTYQLTQSTSLFDYLS